MARPHLGTYRAPVAQTTDRKEGAMSTKAGALGIEHRASLGWRDWVMLVVALVAATSLVVGVLALRRAATRIEPGPAAAAQGFAQQGIYEESAPVSGTGPALAELAEQLGMARIYEGSAPVTGTGPGLVQIADQSSSMHETPVTGTGPDLEFVGR